MGLLSWNLGYWGILPNTQWSLLWLGIALGIFSWFYSAQWRKETLEFMQEQFKLILFFEIIGLLSFLSFLIFRAQVPAIYGAEKYMDFSIFNTLLRNESLPPTDPWMSGRKIHYYYFGHYLLVQICKISGIPGEYGYNLALGTVFFISCMICAWLSYQLGSSSNPEKTSKTLNSSGIQAALLGILLVLIVGNMDGILQFIEKGWQGSFDYWRSSRVIPNAITEFPFFSFIHGDLHAHLLNLPVFLLFLSILFALIKDTTSIGLTVFCAIVLSSLAAINPWDTLPALILLGGWLLFPFTSRKLLTVTALLLGALLLMGGYYLQLPRSVSGIGRVSQSTTLLELLTVITLPFTLITLELLRPFLRKMKRILGWQGILFVFTGYLFSWFLLGTLMRSLSGGLCLGMSIACFYMAWSKRHSTEEYFSWIMGGTGFILLAIPEMFFFRDPFSGTENYRMNTIFKSYFTGWTLLAVAGVSLFIKARKQYNEYLLGGLLGLLFTVMIYPVCVLGRTGISQPSRWTLNGMAYLHDSHPDDLNTILWINRHIQGTPTLLEYGNEAYTYSGRISSNTGLPSILGWANHEQVWRNDPQTVEKRLNDLSLLWKSKDEALTDALIKKYHIQYVYLGDIENYFLTSEQKDKWFTRGQVIYESNNMVLIKLNNN